MVLKKKEKNRGGKEEDQNNFWGMSMDMDMSMQIFFEGTSTLSKNPKITHIVLFFRREKDLHIGANDNRGSRSAKGRTD